MLAEGMELSSPLVLLICPSLLTRAVKVHADRIIRDVPLALARTLEVRKEPNKP